MDKIDKKIINEIAQNLEIGDICYFNYKTNKVISIPDIDDDWDETEFEDLFKADLKKIKKQKKDLIKIEPLESYESFKIMEQFVEQITDQVYKSQLEDLLQRQKPFQNFKHSIEQSKFRQAWFDFRLAQFEKKVLKEIDLISN